MVRKTQKKLKIQKRKTKKVTQNKKGGRGFGFTDPKYNKFVSYGNPKKKPSLGYVGEYILSLPKK